MCRVNKKLTHHALHTFLYILSFLFIFNLGTPSSFASSTVLSAEDKFTRNNQTFWGTASDGLFWGLDANTQNFFSINNRTGQMVGDNTGKTYGGTLGPTISDTEVLVTGRIDNTYTNSNWGPVVRLQDSNNFYKVIAGSADNPIFGKCYFSSGTYLIMQKRQNGTYTEFSCIPYTVNPGVQYSIRLQAIGSQLNARIWQSSSSEPSSWMISANDSAFSSGADGVRILSNSGAVGHIIYFAAYKIIANQDTCTPAGDKCFNNSCPGGFNPAPFTCVSGVCCIQKNQASPTPTPTAQPGNTPTPTPKPVPTATPTPTPALYRVSGNIYVDLLGNGVKDGADYGYPGATVTINNTNSKSDAAGNYVLNNLPPGSYTITVTASGFQTATQSVTVAGNVFNFNIGIKPSPCSIPAFTISGKNYSDNNTDGFYQPGIDALYTGPGATVTITGCSSTITLPVTGGSYTSQPIPNGTYTVTYPTVPSGYNMTYPLFGIPPSFTVTIGPACSNPNKYHDMSCSSGNISGLNFGMNNAPPWVQNVCGDTRIDTGFNYQLPPSPTNSCGAPSGSYEIVSNATCSNVPGIAYSGSTGNPATMFGATGKASVANWIVGGSAYPETFSSGSNTTIKTSYAYFLTSARKSGITPIDLASVCTLANCTLPNNLVHGIYQANSSVTFNAATYTFPGNANYVFLINGTVTILGNMLVPTGSTATVASTGNIIVDKNVGEASSNSCQSDVEGFYTTDSSFVVNSVGGCSIGPDKRLNIAGSVIMNAAQKGGSLQNSRDLCIGNANTPSITFTQRPDFLLNAPSLIKRQNHIWQEIAP